MSTSICQHCQAKNEAETELCVACGRPLRPVDPEPRPGAGTGPVEREAVEQWVRQLPEFGGLDADSLARDDESLPAWLQAVRAHADKMTSQEADELLDFLADLEPGEGDEADNVPADEAAAQAQVQSELPAWVAALLPDESWPETEADETLAQHFAEVEEHDETRLPSTAPLPATRPLEESRELDGIPELLAGDNLPDWLAAQHSGAKSPDDEEPPEWPSRASRVPAASQEPTRAKVAKPGPEQVAEPEAESGIETIDSVLAEVEAAAVDRMESTAGSEEDLSGFSDWMDPAQTAALEETLEQMLDLPEADTSEGRVGQWLDILEGLPGGRGAEELDQTMSDSDLETAEMPDWMHALQPEQGAEQRGPGDLGSPEERGPLAGIRGVIPAATLSLTGGVDRSTNALEMTKEQRQQAALLRRLTSAAPGAAVAERQGGDPSLASRLILGGALLLVILLALLIPGLADLLPEVDHKALPPAALQARESVVASAGQSALVAFDYTPAMAGELDAVAEAILADLAANNITVLTVSQVAAGVPLAEQAVAATDGLTSVSIGYLPGEASGLRALGACLDSSCQAIVGRRLSSETQAALTEVSLIVVLAADRDSLAGWIEQVGAQSEVNIVAGVTQALGPVARPYLQSQQLAGLVEGLPVSVAFERDGQGDSSQAAKQMAGVTLAQWLTVAVLVAGLVYYGLVAPTTLALNRGTRK